MTIGTPLWDDFVENLKEVKLTVEGMGFMPVNPPSDKELGNVSRTEKHRRRRVQEILLLLCRNVDTSCSQQHFRKGGEGELQ